MKINEMKINKMKINEMKINEMKINEMKINKKMLSRKILICVIFILAGSMCLVGCGKNKRSKSHKKTKIVLTTDFDDEEVFRIEKSSCYVPEVMLYLVNSENEYDEIFGSTIWNVTIDGVSIEDKYKDVILARIAQIKVMNILAENRNIVLLDDEEKKVECAARDYYRSLSDIEIDIMQVSEEDVLQVYREYAIANKLYYDITDEVNPEISDDEARTITIHSILIKTYTTDENGNKLPYSEGEKRKALERAQEVASRLNEGEDFDVLADSYLNEDIKTEYSFGRGVMPAEIEDTAFNMANGDISGIIETDYGYHIIKCVSTFNKEETDKNKMNIVNQKKQEAFNSVYDEFVVGLNSNLNAPLWEELSYTKTDSCDTKNLFEEYDKYFVMETDEKINN